MDILKKRVTRKDFLKTIGLIVLASLVSFKSFNIFNKKPIRKTDYGLGTYGGQ